MKRLFYLILGALTTHTAVFSQFSTTYSLEDFNKVQIEEIIDSIWNEVVSWDGDTAQMAFLKREKYADELETYHFQHTAGNTALNSPEGKALLYSFFIRFRNNNRKRIIETFSQDLDNISPELWHMIYPIYSKNLKAELKENKAWVPVLNRFGETDTSVFHKMVSWWDLGMYYYTDEDMQMARKYFANMVNEKSSFTKGKIHGLILRADSYMKSIDELLIGQPAPNFCAQDIKAQEICMNPDQNMVYLLEFWATWCAPCRADLPKIHLIYDMYKDRNDFQLIGISLDQDTNLLKKFIAKNGIKWPQIWEGGDKKREGKITLLYNGLSLPTYYVIDKEGIIKYNYDSRMNGKDLELVLEEVMKE